MHISILCNLNIRMQSNVKNGCFILLYSFLLCYWVIFC